MLIERTCPVCETVYLANTQRLKWRHHITCSLKCSYIHRGQQLRVDIVLKCAHCKTKFTRKPGQNKRTTTPFCSLECYRASISKDTYSGPGMKICTSPDCIRLGQPQPLENFANSNRSKDGKDWWCKDCKKRWDKQYKASESGKKVEAEYRKTPKYIKSRKIYARSETAKELARQRAALNRKDPQKVARILARNKLNKAVRAGKIPHISTQKCIRCNEQAQQYHHYLGYEPEHWYDVEPYCYICHDKVTREHQDSLST